MRVYLTNETWGTEKNKYNAGDKARTDIVKILSDNVETIAVPLDKTISRNMFQVLKHHHGSVKKWSEALETVGYGDILFLQFPVIDHSVFLAEVLKKRKRCGARIVLIIHDLELLRLSLEENVSTKVKVRYNLEERTVMSLADIVVVHNEMMRDKVQELGLASNADIITLEIFDYLCNDTSFEMKQREGGVIVAGNLSSEKAGYLRHLPAGVNWRLYGIGVEGETIQNAEYFGKFEPDNGPDIIKGDYGLVWDGNSPDTCAGSFGNYLRYNNPHKASLYLAAGIPLIVWSKSALARFVANYGVGLTVSSLHEVPNRLREIDSDQYMNMQNATNALAQLIRTGYHTSKVFYETIERLS